MTIVIKILRAVRGFLCNVRLVEAGRRRAFITLILRSVFPCSFTGHAFFRRRCNGLVRFVGQVVNDVHPVRYGLVATVEVINGVTNVSAV